MGHRIAMACGFVVVQVWATLTGPNAALAADDLTMLVGYWPFNEGSGSTTEDLSGNGHDGVINGGVEWTTGTFGNALAFNGTDGFVDVPTMYGMAGLDEGTIEFWVNVSLWDDYDNLLGTQSASNNVNSIRFERTYPDNDPISIYQGGPGGGYSILTSSNTLSEGTWTHVAYAWVRAEDSGALYLDGVRTEGSMTNWPEAYPAMRIGTGYSGRWTEGTIDDVRMWSTALTEEQVAAHMAEGELTITAVSPMGKLTTSWARIKGGV